MAVVINADDFGASPTINDSVISAYEFGTLRSASLLVTGAAAQQAVEMARRSPGLAVGLHLLLAGGTPVSSSETIPRLVDSSGRLPQRPVWLGVRIALNRAARLEMRSELAAQFDAFSATGLPLSHVDGHLHLHLHPLIFPTVVELAVRYGAHAIRLPRDELWTSLRHDRRHLFTKLWWWLIFGLLNRNARRHLRRAGLVVADRVFGLMQSGNMEESYVLSVLHELAGRTAEVYLHPDRAARRHPLGPNPGDLATLLSPAVLAALRERGGPATFSDLSGRS